MKLIKRRDFIRQTAQLTAGLAATSLLAGKEAKGMEKSDLAAAIPLPIQIVIDDVGWWSGEDGSKRQEPYRTGIQRAHVPADYQAIVDLGKGLGVRPQAATILCEWDRENILQQVPTSTWMREKWDNRRWVGPWLEQAAEIIRSNPEHYELTLHGIGHEYWADQNFTRAEWTDKAGHMRPRDQVERHLDFYARLLQQNQLGPFPRSFVPTAFLHRFGPEAGVEMSLAAILKQRGITYINTPFSTMTAAKEVQFGLFGIDADVMTVDRGEDLFNWNVIGGIPEATLCGPTCGMHWPNLLHADPALNSEIVAGWVSYLAPCNSRLETLLAPDSGFFQQQLAHQVCTLLSRKGRVLELDFRKIESVPEQAAGRRFILKVRSASRLQFKATHILAVAESCINGKENFLYTLTLERIPEKKSARIECVPAA